MIGPLELISSMALIGSLIIGVTSIALSSGGLEGFGKDLPLVRFRLVQVSVESHRHIADKDPSQSRDFDPLAAELHQLIALKFAQAFKLCRKMLVKADSEIAFDFGFHHHPMTQDAI